MQFVNKVPGDGKKDPEKQPIKSTNIVTIRSLLATDEWIGIALNEMQSYTGTESYLNFTGRINIYDLHKKLLDKDQTLAVRFCLMILIRGKKFSKYVTEPAAREVVQTFAKQLDLQVSPTDTKNNKPDTVAQALAPFMLVASQYLNFSTNKLEIKGAEPYTGTLPLPYRWHGSTCMATKGNAAQVIPEYESWAQHYIKIRRRPGKKLSSKEIANAIVSRAADRSWYGRSLEAYSEATKKKWAEGAATGDAEQGTEWSIGERKHVVEALKYNPWAYIPRPKRTGRWDRSTIELLVSGGFCAGLGKEFELQDGTNMVEYLTTNLKVRDED